jgi:methylmalonyl-CoA/ethylmalonyl-CoA epimerase
MSETSLGKQIFNDFAQIGVVVRDIHQTMKVLTEVFGIGPWRVFNIPPEDHKDLPRFYYGKPTNYSSIQAFAELGPVELELIQPLEGESIFTDFLEKRGPGIHHIRFNIEHMEPVVEHLKNHNIGVAQSGLGIRPGTEWANFDTERLIGFTIEVLKKLPGTDGRTPSKT